jgi:hypothetical protein
MNKAKGREKNNLRSRYLLDDMLSEPRSVTAVWAGSWREEYFGP